ncbi:MAG: response regulator, partial [Actinobacteria bacterium]|nr:response regulator [Actinomycetota bacterium]
PYDTSEVIMPPGSRLLLYSDGLFELAQPDGQMATLDDYIESLDKAPTSSLDAMLGHARQVQASDNFKDDVSVLEVRFRG